jgi:membrane protease YdiL (CAAX protease family)
MLLRAVLLGSAVNSLATAPCSGLLRVNFSLAPGLPWSTPVVVVYLWLYWQYLRGKGWPPSTSASRRAGLRARELSRPAWRWSLLAGGLGWAAVVALRIVAERLLAVPSPSAHGSAAHPWILIVPYVLSASAVAGIAEEAGFRGYMQAPIERRHGPLVAILVVGVVFWLSHFSHFVGRGWLFLRMLWFYLAAAVVFGLLVHLTDSILPGIVLHATADVVGFGLWLAWPAASPVDTGSQSALLLGTGVPGLLCLAAAVLAYRKLAATMRAERGTGTAG